MEYRLLGRSGLKISVLTFGTMTFGGEAFFAKTGSIDLAGDLSLIAPHLKTIKARG
jgi:aryl-alcohol dehydrogenase-like predicted oxidoreductase